MPDFPYLIILCFNTSRYHRVLVGPKINMYKSNNTHSSICWLNISAGFYDVRWQRTKGIILAQEKQCTAVFLMSSSRGWWQQPMKTLHSFSLKKAVTTTWSMSTRRERSSPVQDHLLFNFNDADNTRLFIQQMTANGLLVNVCLHGEEYISNNVELP